MRITAGVFVVSLGVAILFDAGIAKSVVHSDCPFKDNDKCDQWQFEQLDMELTAVIDGALAVMERHSTAVWLPEAKLLLMKAHRQWATFRDDDCRSQVAYPGVMSARTSKGKMAKCQLIMTDQRIKELNSRFNLKK